MPATAVIPEKKDQAANRKEKGSRGGYDAELHKARNTVERLINKLKAYRIATTRVRAKQQPLG